MLDTQVAVMGAGLGGLYAARLLARAKIEFVLLEAQQHLGGRVLSRQLEGPSPPQGGYDLGPTWFWPDVQPRLPRLLDELGIASFRQQDDGDFVFEASRTVVERIPNGTEPGESMRIEGGMQTLVDALAAGLEPARIRRGARVVSASLIDEGIELAYVRPNGDTETLRARQVISTLPPRLLAERLAWRPALPAGLISGWSAVPTWMAGHAKFVAVYRTPFWKAAGLSGHAQSRVGPLAEIHDASPQRGLPALFGFLGIPPPSRRLAGDNLKTLVLAQLQRLFGPEATQPVATFYKDWSADAFVATARDQVAQQSHPAYGQQAALPAPWQRAFLLAGTEAARTAGGYLEGALEASEQAVARVPRPAKT
jgi:monoamine oxidase